MRNFLAAIFTFTGMVIGAGILGIPYVVVRAGFWTGMLCIVLVGVAMLIVKLMLGELSLKTKGNHQLPGFAEAYLGRKGKYILLFTTALTCYSAIVAYTLGVSESLTVMLGGSQQAWAIIFYGVMALVIYGGINILAGSETLLEVIQFLVLFGVLYLAFASPFFSTSAFTGFSLSSVLSPVGVLLFAFSGLTAVPLMKEVLHRDRKTLKWAIICGKTLVAVIYVVFAIAVIGITGLQTTEVATTGLSMALGPMIGFLIGGFAVLAMTTSFIALGFVLKEMFSEDFGLSDKRAWFLTMVVPPLVIGLGARSFTMMLDIGGSIAIGIAGVLILLMHWKSRERPQRKPEYTIRLPMVVYLLLGLLFVLAVVNSLYSLF